LKFGSIIQFERYFKRIYTVKRPSRNTTLIHAKESLETATTPATCPPGKYKSICTIYSIAFVLETGVVVTV